jgi:probable HAF family extracellular repeat protein
VSTFAYGINTVGAIVGGYTASGNTDHGFLWQGGTFTTLDVPGAVSTFASDINDAGAIVGGYTASGNTVHGFVIP